MIVIVACKNNNMGVAASLKTERLLKIINILVDYNTIIIITTKMCFFYLIFK